LKMRQQKRKVCLTIDNFSGHEFAYEPTNVQLEFFAPNLTSFVQPLDAGVIRCFKAHYQRAFCIRALDLDDAGEQDIYKINLLEAMLMAKEAWDSVTAQTIEHCWEHTGIQRAPILLRIPTAPTPTQPVPNSQDMAAPSIPPMTQSHALEAELMDCVVELKRRNRIFGSIPSLDDLLDPTEEQEIGDMPYWFEGGDAEIVAQVHHEQAIERGEVVEVDSDSEGDDDDDPPADLSTAEIIRMCEQLERVALGSGLDGALEFLRNSRRFRAQLTQADFQRAKQVTLTSLWGA
jgi:hypothetical protein